MILRLLLFLSCFYSFGQTARLDKDNFTVYLEDGLVVLEYLDENDPVYFYENGEYIQTKGKLTLTDKEFKNMIKRMKKLLRFQEGNFRSSVYDLDKFSFVNDTIYLWVNNKIGSFSNKDIKDIEKKFKL
tara:strand:- start:975 stop:1361 length:387 start_codon:yes stop_codon:yes gene_type:complete